MAKNPTALTALTRVTSAIGERVTPACEREGAYQASPAVDLFTLWPHVVLSIMDCACSFDEGPWTCGPELNRSIAGLA